ncbi:MAG: DUF7017 domain-containing protein [Sphingomonadales bacterium]|jgi:hypothetical protein
MTTVKELRKEGKLEEALELANSNMQQEPDNIWNKRALLWVYYDYLKQINETGNIIPFYNYVEKIAAMGIDADEDIFLEQLTWQIGKMINTAVKKMEKDNHYADNYVELMVKAILPIPFHKPSKGFSFLMDCLHKYYKDRWNYKEIMDWAGLENLTEEDFVGQQYDGRTMMSLGEKVYIAYSKALLKGDVGPDSVPAFIEGILVRVKSPRREPVPYPKEELQAVIERLETLSEKYPRMIYFGYYKAKLLLLSGSDKSEIMEELLPFVRKKQDEFWAWDVMADALSDDPDKVLACYCRACLCNSPATMMVSLKEKLAAILLKRALYVQAKTEIDAIVSLKQTQNHRINDRLNGWLTSAWYASAQKLQNNKELYNQFADAANELLYGDSPEQLILVDFVNSDKKMLNFISEDNRVGFFKYERFIKTVKPGDLLHVRFSEFSKEGPSKVHTVKHAAERIEDTKFYKVIEGEIKISQDKGFGFVGDIYVHPSIVSKAGVDNYARVKVIAHRTYSTKKKALDWKVIELNGDEDWPESGDLNDGEDWVEVDFS